jgi:manganese-dependent inorganic pyrophosphatase
MKSIIGHRNPDTDTICSAIAYQDLLEKKNIKAKAFALGELNNETKFVLNKFQIEFPEVINNLPKNSEIILVDHNEEGQSIENFNDLDVVEVIDHHKANIQTDKPIRIHIEPLGSSCSIIAKKFIAKNFEISEKIASILIAGIISDTLYFRSPTTTKTDKELVEKLNKIAKIDLSTGGLEKFSMEMFDAKSDVIDLTTEELVKLDYKNFNFCGHKIGIGVMETTNKDFGLNRKKEILEILKKIKADDKLEAVYFSVIDILKEENYTLSSGDQEKQQFVDIFNSKEQDGILYHKGLVSRKKEIVPQLEKYFKKIAS